VAEVTDTTRSFRFQQSKLFLQAWLSGAELERTRLKTDEPWWQADATFFVYSLRNLLRAAQLAAECAPDASVAGDIQRHIHAFEESLPRLIDLRDVLALR
jgi:hypothetical protein